MSLWHTDLTDLTDFEPSARCEWQLVTVIGLLWLLACCGYWLVVVIDLLCFKWQIKKRYPWAMRSIGRVRSVRTVCLKNESRVPNKIRFIHKIRVQKNLMFKCERTAANKDPWDPWDPCAKKMSSMCKRNIRVIRVITSLRSVGLRRISCSKKSRVQVCRKTFVLFELFVFKKNIEWHFVFQDLVQPSSSPIPSAIDSPSKCHR